MRRPTIILLVSCVVLVLGAARTGVSAAACPPLPQPASMDNPAYYDYVNSYTGDCAAHTNWDRSFPDVTVRKRTAGGELIELTTSTALAGAVASLKVDGREYLASGGHGSALQWAFHAWPTGAAPSECYNPTQAGSRSDDTGQPPPYHGPSTSALYVHGAVSASTITAQLRPAMYIPRSSPDPGFGGCRASDLQADRSPYTFGLSPYWLVTGVGLPPENGRPELDNVVRLTARLTSEDELYGNFDGLLVAYLQRTFVDAFTLDVDSGALTARNPGDPGASRPIVRCTRDRTACLGMYFRPAEMPSAYYYALSNGPSPYNGMSGEYTTQVTVPARDVGAGGQTTLDYETDIAVGTLARTVSAIRALSTAPAPPPGTTPVRGAPPRRPRITVTRAQLRGRGRRTLDVRARVLPSDGPAQLRVGDGRAARTFRVNVSGGRLAVRRRLARSLVTASAVPLEVIWRGGGGTAPARSRLLAATRAARLRVTRLAFDRQSRRVSLSGRMSPRAHGSVAVAIAPDDATLPSAKSIRIPIRRGRFAWRGRVDMKGQAVVSVTFAGDRRAHISGATYTRGLSIN